MYSYTLSEASDMWDNKVTKIVNIVIDYASNIYEYFVTSHYSDPFWQKVLYIYLDPVFRLLHCDKYNISVILMCFAAIICTKSIFSLLFGLIGLGLFAIKTLVLGDSTRSIYTRSRQYNNSYLDISQDVPILYLNGNTAFDDGYEYGVLLCDEIVALITHFKYIVNKEVPFWLLKKINRQLPNVIKDEIYGMYKAINTAKPGVLSYFDLLAVQMIPELNQVGCTCYAVKEDGHIKFGRNMDWLSFASAQYSVIVHYGNYKSLVVPGLIGCLTAWNNSYVLAMNVVGGHDDWNINGLPSMLNNKMIMIKNSNALDARIYAKKLSPCYSYHLTIADKNEVSCYSYTTYPTSRKIFSRYLDNDTLVVLNWTYPENINGRFISAYRHNKTKPRQNVADVLRDCQSFSTLHSLIFDFKTNTYQVNCNNGYAADLLI